MINGTNNLFNVSLLAQGIQGGRATAQNLTKAIADYLAREDVQIFGRLSFWITIYFKKAEYAEFLLGNGLCSLEQFEGFLSVSLHCMFGMSSLTIALGFQSGITSIHVG